MSYRLVGDVGILHAYTYKFIFFPKIDTDLQPDNAEKLLKQDVDYDKPGLAQFYCVHCA